MTKQEFMAKHDFNDLDFRNLQRYDQVRARGEMNMFELNYRTRYFLITGLDNGIEIEPYIIETWGNVPHLEVYGDKARYVEPISKKKAMELIEQGVELV